MRQCSAHSVPSIRVSFTIIMEKHGRSSTRSVYVYLCPPFLYTIKISRYRYTETS